MGVAIIYVVNANHQGESKIHLFARKDEAEKFKTEMEEKHPNIKVTITPTPLLGEGGNY